MPSDLTLKLMNGVHRAAIRLSFGRLGWSAAAMPVLELTTTGRRTGRPRTVLLTSPLQLGDTYLVVASRGGDDQPPAWLGNLIAQPQVQVAVGGRSAETMHARVAIAVERAELWPRVVADHTMYAGYQRRTDREIPLVLLEPAR
jgi:deazaflavin-dependent oxidoreductase (nitroreductase family)